MLMLLYLQHLSKDLKNHCEHFFSSHSESAASWHYHYFADGETEARNFEEICQSQSGAKIETELRTPHPQVLS